MNSKRMAKNKHRHKKANAAAATEKKKAGGRKIFSTVFQPEASSGLSLKSADKHLILEALDELYALRSAREGGTAGDAPAEGQGDTSRSKKKPKPRKKARKGVYGWTPASSVKETKECDSLIVRGGVLHVHRLCQGYFMGEGTSEIFQMSVPGTSRA